MDTNNQYRIPLTIALLALFWQTAQASDEAEIYRLITPESTISNFGVGYQGDNNAQYFGEYNGMNQRGAFGLLDAEIVKRDNETGTWYKFTTSNLGLEDRDIRWEHSRQGDWGYSIDYSQIPRYNPFLITTGLQGLGTTNQTVSRTAPQQTVQLETERKRFTVDLNKYLPAGYDVEVRYTHEEKTGNRMYGQQGGGAPNEVWFLAEPIDYTTQQVDAILRYTGENLQLSGGYWGAWFTNPNPALNVTAQAPLTGAFTPMALPPDNQSHQVNLTGGYSFTPATRATFKAAYTYQVQNEAFIVPVVPTSNAFGNSNLQGRLDTWLAQAGVTSQLTNKLSTLADVRYENRNDMTPIFQYTPVAIGATTTNGNNEPRSITTIDSKLQASYVLPMNFRFTAGGNYIVNQRTFEPVRSVSYRYETDEISYRGELRRALSETVTGAVSYVYSSRWGSPFLNTTLLNGAQGSNLISPLYLANRASNTVKVTSNWTPTEKLSFQAFGSAGWVDYSSRNSQDLGLQSGQTQNYSADATYTFNDKWQANAWYTYNQIRVSQSTCSNASVTGGICPNTAVNPTWAAWLQNVSNTFGVGTKGQVTSKLEVSANAEYSRINDYYPMATLIPAGAPINAGVPSIYTNILDLKLGAKYALQKNMGFRFNYIYNHFKTNDWTWNTFTYGDGTTVTQNPNQVVNFFGVSYYLTWQ